MRELTEDQLGGMKGLAFVEIYKPGCVPCENLQPILEALSPKYDGKADFYSSHFVRGGLGQKFGLQIEHVPTIVLLKDGAVVQQFPGAKYAGGVGSERVAADASFLEKKLDSLVTTHYTPPKGRETYKEIAKGLETQLDLGENSLVTLAERYLMKDAEGRIVENPEGMFRRVADNVASADSMYKGNTEQTANRFYEMMSKLEFLPNSPTLMNAGRDLQQLSACFVLPVEDTMESIFGTAMNGAIVHKSGGGTGYSFSRLRPAKSVVRSTSGIASGPVSFIKVFDIYTEVVKQGGTRRGANMGILRVDHPDIRGFIHAKGEPNEVSQRIIDAFTEATGLEKDHSYTGVLRRKLLEIIQLNNFNLSAGITSDFMDALKRDGYYELVNPQTGKVTERVRAKSILEEIVDQSWKTGDPGIVFLDRINEHNPTPQIGEIEATNPCGEQPLLPYESCNLGSINLAKFVTDGKIDFARLKDTVHTAVHFLDNVIDVNKYPLPEIEKMTKANRKVGLGVMGFADMVTTMGIAYGSEDSFEVAESVMKFIRDEARVASAKLAEERGLFPNWQGSIYDPTSKHFKGEELKLRNATLTTIAPTGTLAQIANCEWGIEPPFSLAYIKTVMDGKVLHYRFRGLERVLTVRGYDTERIFTELEKGNKRVLKELPDDIKKLAVTSMNLIPEQHVRTQAAFQKYTDNAVSKTINFPSDATREDLQEALLLAHKLGCKGITVYRDKSKDVQVMEEKRPKETYDFGSKRPKRLISIVRRETVGDDKNIFVTTSYWEDDKNTREITRLEESGRPAEIFCAANFFDPATYVSNSALVIRISKDLRAGIDPKSIVEDLKHLPPSDEFGYDQGEGEGGEYVNKSVPDALWKALSGWRPPVSKKDKIQEEPDKTKEGKDTQNRNGLGFCSNCSTYSVVSREGCDQCLKCGKSRKGCS